MANNKKTYKPLEKTQLNRIAEEQEMKLVFVTNVYYNF